MIESAPMLTVSETIVFVSDSRKIWSEDERLEFISYLSANPKAGEVCPGSGGCRKVRWSREGSGKRGGVRVIYFVAASEQSLWLLLIYSKAQKDNIPAHVLKSIRMEFENA